MVPRHAVPGPHTRQHGEPGEELPCLLDLPGILFTTSGRAAILLGLEALALASTDRVLVPSYHCPTMVSPVMALGLPVGFYPIDADGYPALAWLEQNAPVDTRVLCVTHFFGLPLDLRAVQAWCRHRGVLLVEDCAHAMFGQSSSGAMGTLGDVAVASLPKFFAVRDGGLLRVGQRRQPTEPLEPAGLKAELKGWLDNLEISARYGRLGCWTSWASPILAAKRALRGRTAPNALAAALHTDPAPSGDHERIDTVLSHRAPTRVTVSGTLRSARNRVVGPRRSHYATMASAFANRPGLRPLFPALPERCAPYVFPLWVDRPDPAYQQLRALGVPVSRWEWLWPGVPDMPGDQGKYWSRHVLQLHCHQDMTDQDLNWVIDALLAHCTS